MHACMHTYARIKTRVENFKVHDVAFVESLDGRGFSGYSIFPVHACIFPCMHTQKQCKYACRHACIWLNHLNATLQPIEIIHLYKVYIIIVIIKTTTTKLL